MKMIKMFSAMFLVAAGLVAGSPGAQAATSPPPGLAGEVFLSPQGPADATATGFCESTAQAGTFTYHATGTATGPYPGTFVEDITIGAAKITTPNTTSTLTSFHVTFAITSAAGTVTGTKDFVVGGGGFAWCLGTFPIPSIFGFFEAPALTYSATIDTGGVRYRDSGTASARDAEFQSNQAAVFKTFSETFLTSNGVVPDAPTSKDQCQNGGWKNYPQFKNQGQCVSYVQHQSP